MKRIQSIDGVRAISILMVTFGHALFTLPQAISSNKIILLLCNAALGVQIFFVISGYLITKLLLIEREQTGRTSLKDFYIRRILRIFPVFFLYLGVVVALKYTLIPSIYTDYSLVIFAALYLWNYRHFFIQESPADNGSFYMGHTWSLSMEEQFYLLWPLTFLKNKKETLIKIAIAILLLMPFIRIATYFLMPSSRFQMTTMLHTGGDTIIMGCLGALLEKTPFFGQRIVPLISRRLVILTAFIFVFFLSPIAGLYLKGIYKLTVGQTMDNLAIMILLFWCIYIPSKISLVLNSKIFVQIGILSYSLYIWQPIFLTDRAGAWINRFPQNILLVFAVALISYYLIEKPILKLKKRFKH